MDVLNISIVNVSRKSLSCQTVEVWRCVNFVSPWPQPIIKMRILFRGFRLCTTSLRFVI